MSVLEQCLFLTMAYLCYTVNEALTLSGIMSLLFFGQVRFCAFVDVSLLLAVLKF